MLKTIRIFHLLLLTGWVTTLLSCQSAKKSYQSGNFETAIEKAARKLRNDRTDEDNIIYLEAAYDRLYYQVKDRVSFLRKEGRPENTVAIFDEYSVLKMYEGMIKPLLPLYIESKKRNAQFKFISDEEFIESKKLSAEYLYSYAGGLLANGTRSDARRAYELYEELKCIYPTYKDADARQREALIAGTNQVNVVIQNKSGAPLFTELEKQLTTLPVGDLNSEWVNFSNEKNTAKSFDYQVNVTILYLSVTPDLQLVNNTITERKTVEDGWEYVLDSRGNVMKDSLGNDIKQTKYKTIKCIVTEYVEKKQASIAGTIDFYDSKTNSLLYSYPLDIQEVFEHHWATANGDLKALSPQSNDLVKIGPLPFPTEIEMLVKAGDDLKLKLKEAVRDHIQLLSGT